jgi:hypothetical protein
MIAAMTGLLTSEWVPALIVLVGSITAAVHIAAVARKR